MEPLYALLADIARRVRRLLPVLTINLTTAMLLALLAVLTPDGLATSVLRLIETGLLLDTLGFFAKLLEQDRAFVVRARSGERCLYRIVLKSLNLETRSLEAVHLDNERNAVVPWGNKGREAKATIRPSSCFEAFRIFRPTRVFQINARATNRHAVGFNNPSANVNSPVTHTASEA